MKIRHPRGQVEVLDAQCAHRPCLRVGEWKGVLTPGVGYRYAPRSQWHLECLRRATRGCPDPIPEPVNPPKKCAQKCARA